MVIGVVLVSFIKPLAFSRYFLVLLPVVVPVQALMISRPSFNRSGFKVALAGLLVLLLSWWGPGFAELNPAADWWSVTARARVCSTSVIAWN